MSVQPTGHSTAPGNVSFEIKSSQLPLVALILKSNDWATIAKDLNALYGDSGERPGFFERDPVLLDFSALDRNAQWSDIQFLFKGLSSCNLLPVAFRAEPVGWIDQLLKAGLVQAPTEITKIKKAVEKVVASVPESVREVPGLSTMVIDKPIRSGQKIYARGADLVVLAMVNQGAEVVADGNIHVYAPLRGKAMAGARGNVLARIFSLCMEPELISIAGVYRTSETPLPSHIAGKPAQVRLSSEEGQDKLLIEPLKN
jgi:septum site-determining protein MinC